MAKHGDETSSSATPEIKATVRRGRLFDLVGDVTGYLPGQLEDWPPQVQDMVYAAMEQLLEREQIKKVEVVQSRCGRDVDTEPYHVIVTVAEVLPIIMTIQ